MRWTDHAPPLRLLPHLMLWAVRWFLDTCRFARAAEVYIAAAPAHGAQLFSCTSPMNDSAATFRRCTRHSPSCNHSPPPPPSTWAGTKERTPPPQLAGRLPYSAPPQVRTRATAAWALVKNSEEQGPVSHAHEECLPPCPCPIISASSSTPLRLLPSRAQSIPDHATWEQDTCPAAASREKKHGLNAATDRGQKGLTELLVKTPFSRRHPP